MPVTRSSGNLQKSSLQKARTNVNAHTSSNNPAVIILTDDDASSARPNLKKGGPSSKTDATNKQQGKERENRALQMDEVIEISSDDEEGSPVVKRPRREHQSDIVATSELQKKVKKLEGESAKIKQENTRIKRENIEMKSAIKVNQDKVLLDVSHVEDIITCEVCSLKLWSPFILPECGHTFCQSCLKNWFHTTLAQHVAIHPNYDINAQPVLIHGDLQHGFLVPQQQVQPRYTCPKCREEVQTRPAEDFVLKSLVRAIAGAAGEASPKKQEPVGGLGQRRDSPWNSFFRSQ